MKNKGPSQTPQKPPLEETGGADPGFSATARAFALDAIARFPALGLAEMDISLGGLRLRLRQAEQPAARIMTVRSHQAVADPTTAQDTPGPSPVPQEGVIRAFSHGIFHSAPAPGARPFVQIGSVVSSDSPVCVVEAMKVFTTIQAGLSGRIVGILCKDGDIIAPGDPLFTLAPGGQD